jgi:hypothetical protein
MKQRTVLGNTDKPSLPWAFRPVYGHGSHAIPSSEAAHQNMSYHDS